MALLHVDYHSYTLKMDMQMDVVLPETTQGQIGMQGHSTENGWKTLYLLHGMSDDHTIWQRRTSIERYAADKGIAVVMPTTHLGWYTDMYAGLPYFTFVTEELPKLCRQFFPKLSAKREDNFVAGLSMGGFGAMKCGLRAAHVFSKAASLSGAMDTELRSGREGEYWRDIFGPIEDVKGSINDLFAAAEEMKDSPLRPSLYMWCGTEDFLYDENVRMRAHLEKLGYDLTYEECHGIHRWDYWDWKIQKVLSWMLDGKEDA